MNTEGRLDIRLSLNDQGDRQVQIESSRPLAATKIFHGKKSEEVLKILPMLYNVCGNAQAQAAQTAIMNARGCFVSPDQRENVAREMLVLVETAKEHLCRILMDWPGYIDEDNDVSELKAVLQMAQLFKQGLFEQGIAFADVTVLKVDKQYVQALIDQLDDLLQRLIFVNKPQDWFSFNDKDLLFEWIENENTVASRLLKQIKKLELEKQGVNDIGFLPELDEERLLEHFTATDAEDFIAQPSWNDKPHESTSLVRQKEHPLIKSLLIEYENGLLTRLIARLLELAEIPARLRDNLKKIEAKEMSDNQPDNVKKSGIGIGQVEAARGHLVHCVELEEDVVKRYQILAPTEWNFHPRGVVAKGLQSLRTKNETLLRQQADMLINAIDPCVAYDITIH